MTEKRLGILVGIALTIMGAMDYLRHQAVGGPAATVLLVIEIATIVLGIGAVFMWARVREVEATKTRSVTR